MSAKDAGTKDSAPIEGGPHVRDARRLVLVRHGETAFNAEGRWQGRRDVPLSEHGREQARAVAVRLHGERFDAVVASPLVRAIETARLATSVEPLIDPAFLELDFGAWEGVQDADVRAQWPELRAQWGTSPDTVRIPSGESYADVRDRAWPALLRRLDSTSGDVLIVAHGGVNRVLLAGILGVPLSHLWRIGQDRGAVNVIEIPRGPASGAIAAARVSLMNATG